jgi:hypothetical protein
MLCDSTAKALLARISVERGSKTRLEAHKLKKIMILGYKLSKSRTLTGDS